MLRDPSGHNNWDPGWTRPRLGKAAQVLKKSGTVPRCERGPAGRGLGNATHPPHGTINCIALNEKGEMSAVTTTSGLAWKIPGRCGRFARSSAAACGSIRTSAAPAPPAAAKRTCAFAGAHTIVENMRHGMSPKDACLDALKRVARNFDNDRKRLTPSTSNFYALRKDGEYAGASLWDKASADARQVAQFAVCTSDQPSRQELGLPVGTLRANTADVENPSGDGVRAPESRECRGNLPFVSYETNCQVLHPLDEIDSWETDRVG